MQHFYLIHRNKCKEGDKKEKHFPNERTEQNSKNGPNKMDTNNLSDAEFKTVIIRMLSEVR